MGTLGKEDQGRDQKGESMHSMCCQQREDLPEPGDPQ